MMKEQVFTVRIKSKHGTFGVNAIEEILSDNTYGLGSNVTVEAEESYIV